MNGGKRAQSKCEPLADFRVPAEIQAEAGSCGLDFWQSPGALRWLSAFLDARPALITVEEGTRRAVVCCLLRRLPLGPVLASAYPYALIVGDAALFWQNGPAVAEALRAQRVVRLEMPFSGDYAGQFTQRDAASSFVEDTRLQATRHVVDMAPAKGDPNWLPTQLAPNTRWAVRKAERLGSRIRLADLADLEAVQAIYAAAMRAKGAPVNYGPDRFRGMLDGQLGPASARIYIGEVQGTPSGIAAVLNGGISRHLIQLAVIPAAQSSRLSDLLVHTAIRDSIGEGCRYFDFMASNPGDTGLLAFKAKWATRPEPIRYAVLRVNRLADFAIDLGRWVNVQRGKATAYLHRAPATASAADEPR